MSSEKVECFSMEDLGDAAMSDTLSSPETDSVALVMKVVLRSSVRSSVEPKLSNTSLPSINSFKKISQKSQFDVGTVGSLCPQIVADLVSG